MTVPDPAQLPTVTDKADDGCRQPPQRGGYPAGDQTVGDLPAPPPSIIASDLLLPPVPVHRITLGPGDRLAVVYPGVLTRYQADVVKAQCRQVFGPDVPVMVFDHGPELRVISDAEVVTGSGDGLPGTGLREDVRG